LRAPEAISFHSTHALCTSVHSDSHDSSFRSHYKTAPVPHQCTSTAAVAPICATTEHCEKLDLCTSFCDHRRNAAACSCCATEESLPTSKLDPAARKCSCASHCARRTCKSNENINIVYVLCNERCSVTLPVQSPVAPVKGSEVLLLFRHRRSTGIPHVR
jgi:hypothetical protein